MEGRRSESHDSGWLVGNSEVIGAATRIGDRLKW